MVLQFLLSWDTKAQQWSMHGHVGPWDGVLRLELSGFGPSFPSEQTCALSGLGLFGLGSSELPLARHTL